MKNVTPDKALIIGLDGVIPKRVYKFAQEGKMPHLKKLLDKGVWANNCLVPFPTITPTNWTSIVTGSWPGTHGLTDFNVHYPGNPLNKTHQGLWQEDSQSQHIWDKLEENGKQSIIVNYPTTWPPKLKNGIQLGGKDLCVDSSRLFEAPPGDYGPYKVNISDEQLFSTDFYPLGNMIEWDKPSNEWKNMPDNQEALVAELAHTFPRTAENMKPKSWFAVITQSEAGDGFDTLHLCEKPDLNSCFAQLREGEWSNIVTQTFPTEDGERTASFTCKLMELSNDGEEFKLYVSPICDRHGWGFPESVENEIPFEEGFPIRAGHMADTLGWLDSQTYIEIVDLQNKWLGNACATLMKNHDWDFFAMHCHSLDWAYHEYATKMDPMTNSDQEEVGTYQAIDQAMYESLDEMIGKMLDAADDSTLIILVSDHGCKATTAEFNPIKILADRGLTQLVEDDEGNMTVDWENSKAVVQRSCHVYVNLKGRDPDGIVEPGQEEQQVKQEIIHALYDYTDEQTGTKPIKLALTREDARILGLHGDRIGDVIFALSPEFGEQHGPHLPTAEYGEGELRGLFLAAGPGIKEGDLMDRTMSLPDIVPTICHLLDWPVPNDVEGSILYQALTDPNQKLKEKQKLKKNYKRLENAFKGEQALTHTYNMK